MKIVGIVDNKAEAYEIQRIARYLVVANRFKKIGKLARLQDIKKRKLKNKVKNVRR